MSKRDWEEIKQKLDTEESNILANFINSNEPFFPSNTFLNPFTTNSNNFSATQFDKTKPSSWIPLYKSSDLSDFFTTQNLYPVRAGQAEFFFYRGDIFFDLQNIDYTEITPEQYKPIDSFVPSTLEVNFQRNENAYLNKAVALGIINHFVEGENYNILETTIYNKNRSRLLYGQFGKIKLTTPLTFKTTYGNKTINPGFQFEIDLVLENKEEIIIFEAKTGEKPQKSFSLLQLYYPLIYFRELLGSEKKIRTVFIDIVPTEEKEEYQLIEISFIKNNFDSINLSKSFRYMINLLA